MNRSDPMAQGSGGRDEEVFWTGGVPRTATLIWFSAFIGAIFLVLSVAAYLDPRGDDDVRVIAMVICPLLTAAFGSVVVALVLHGRRTCVCIRSDGLVCRNWRARVVTIPWSSLRAVVVTQQGGPERYLAIRYDDAEGRTRGRTLLAETWPGFAGGPTGLAIDPIRDSILQRRPFASRREITTWYLARRVIYDDGPPADRHGNRAAGGFRARVAKQVAMGETAPALPGPVRGAEPIDDGAKPRAQTRGGDTRCGGKGGRSDRESHA